MAKEATWNDFVCSTRQNPASWLYNFCCCCLSLGESITARALSVVVICHICRFFIAYSCCIYTISHLLCVCSCSFRNITENILPNQWHHDKAHTHQKAHWLKMVTESLLYELNRRIEENENKTEEEVQNVAVTKIACDCIAQPIQRMKRTEKPSARRKTCKRFIRKRGGIREIWLFESSTHFAY